MGAIFTVDGAAVFAATGGKDFDPALPAVIFVHGAGMDRSVWQAQTRWFAHNGRGVLAVDLPGHGRSAGSPLPKVTDMAAWLLRVMDAAGLETAALAGHSMGAATVLEAAGSAPHRVRALALLGVIPEIKVHPALQSAADNNDHLAIDMVTLWGHGPAARLGGNIAPGLWMLGQCVRLLERAAPGVLGNDLAASAGYVGALAAAAKVTAPTLLLLAARDMMTPARAAKPLTEAISDAREVVLPDCGHMMMVERPVETLAALRGIL